MRLRSSSHWTKPYQSAGANSATVIAAIARGTSRRVSERLVAPIVLLCHGALGFPQYSRSVSA
jgi:hypothetical protein